MTKQTDTTDPFLDALIEEFDAQLDADRKAHRDPNEPAWDVAWYLRRIGEAKDAIERVKAASARQINRIEAEMKRIIERYGGEVEAKVAESIKGTGRKSIDTPFGRAGFRKTAARRSVAIDDIDTACDAAEDMAPDAIRRTLSKTVLRNLFETTGLTLPGTHIEETVPENRFYVKPEPIGKDTTDDNG